MKVLFFSDIHGVYDNLKVLKKLDAKEHFDKIIVLGDMYYHYGKDVPDKDKIVDFLNSFNNRILGVRGNCDSIDDLEISKFNIENDYLELNIDMLDIICTHGHIYNRENDPFISDVFILGHEHFPYILKSMDKTYINVGSISKPRGGSKPSYLVYNDNLFTLYDIEGNVIDSINIYPKKR